MAHLLGLERVSLEYGTKRIFDEATLGLATGDRIGVIGRNGDGKSTLLKLLAKTQQPDSGQITWRSDLRVGMLSQFDESLEGATVRDKLFAGSALPNWEADPRVREILSGLLTDIELDGAVASLSGGQLRRTALAALLIRDWDVLLLDEPTNHLDVEGVAWLAKHLNGRWPSVQGALVVVTHDRWFLDAVCQGIVEVNAATLSRFEGGYAACVLQKAERERSAAATEARRQNLLRKELAWLRRGAPARTSKPKFRLDAAAELIEDEPQPRDPVQLKRLATSRLGKDVVELSAVGFGYPGLPLFEDLDWTLGPGDRFGLVGANGAGKTTLLRLILGELEPQTGRVKRGKTVVPAMLSQSVAELDEFATVSIRDLVSRERSSFQVAKAELSPTQLLELLGFRGPQLQARVGDLSGGERRRLQVLRLLFGEPNLLILDEPSNDLDIEMLNALEDLLDGWAGTLIVVSHDRYLMERVTDHQYALLGDGKLRHLPRGVEQYLELRAARRQQVPGQPPAGSGEAAVSGAQRRELEKSLARVERALEKLASAEQALAAALAETDPTDFTTLARLIAEQQELNAKRDQLESEWLELSVFWQT